jgi:hypothetical protein
MLTPLFPEGLRAALMFTRFALRFAGSTVTSECLDVLQDLIAYRQKP